MWWGWNNCDFANYFCFSFSLSSGVSNKLVLVLRQRSANWRRRGVCSGIQFGSQTPLSIQQCWRRVFRSGFVPVLMATRLAKTCLGNKRHVGPNTPARAAVALLTFGTKWLSLSLRKNMVTRLEMMGRKPLWQPRINQPSAKSLLTPLCRGILRGVGAKDGLPQVYQNLTSVEPWETSQAENDGCKTPGEDHKVLTSAQAIHGSHVERRALSSSWAPTTKASRSRLHFPQKMWPNTSQGSSVTGKVRAHPPLQERCQNSVHCRCPWYCAHIKEKSSEILPTTVPACPTNWPIRAYWEQSSLSQSHRTAKNGRSPDFSEGFPRRPKTPRSSSFDRAVCGLLH